MTDQRTLKRIIAEQRGTIKKQKLIIDELNDNYLKLNAKYEELERILDAAPSVCEGSIKDKFLKGCSTPLKEPSDCVEEKQESSK